MSTSTLPTNSATTNTATTGGTVRVLAREDLPEITRLWDATYYKRQGDCLPDLQKYLDDVFFQAPCQAASSLRSLVFESRDGRIAGFLGCHPRAFVFGQRSVSAACCGQLMLHPSFRGRRISYELLGEFYAGRQEFSFHATASRSRVMHRSLGAHNPPFYGLCWHKKLRPAKVGLRRIANSSRLGPFRHLLLPVVKPKLSRKRPLDQLPVDVAEVRRIHERVHDGSCFHIAINLDELSWRLRLITQSSHAMGFARVVHDGNEPTGLLVWVVDGNGAAMVLESLAVPGCEQQVLQALLDDARAIGVESIRGYCADERDVLAVQAVGATLEYRPSTCIVHSNDNDILHEFLNRPPRIAVLDGEGWFDFPRT